MKNENLPNGQLVSRPSAQLKSKTTQNTPLKSNEPASLAQNKQSGTSLRHISRLDHRGSTPGLLSFNLLSDSRPQSKQLKTLRIANKRQEQQAQKMSGYLDSVQQKLPSTNQF